MTAEIPADATRADLHRLAIERPDLRAEIARHPALYAELRDWLAGLGDPAVDAALAAPGRVAAPGPVPPAVEPAAVDAAVAPASPRRPSRWKRLLALVAGSLVLVVGAVVGGIWLYDQPRYPETSPIERDDLVALLESVPWVEQVSPRGRAHRASANTTIEGVEPRECGVFRSFGNSGPFGADETASEDFWTMKVPERGPADWFGVRLFPSTEAAESFVEGMRGLLARCSTFVDRHELEHELIDRSEMYPMAELAAFTPTYRSSMLVLRRDNAVFTVLFYEAAPGSAVREVVAEFVERPIP